MDQDFKELLQEFHDSKDLKAKAALPPMIRQKSAPLWDHMLNPRKDGSVDPLNLANRLENNEITYDKAVEEAREYYKKEQESSNKKKGGRKKRKSRRKRRKTKRKNEETKKKKRRENKKRFRNQRDANDKYKL